MKTKHILLLVIIQIAILFLGACGQKGPLPPADKIPPRVSLTSPTNGAQNVPINSSVMITFSEDMAASTINEQTITLSTKSGNVPGSVTYSDKTVVFKPASDMSPNTIYTVTVDGSVTDEAGNAMVTPFGYMFITGTGTDTAPPSVSATNPADSTKNVSPNAALSVTFSEPVDQSTIAFVLSAGSATVPCTMTYSGATAIFTPSSPMSYNTQYTATVNSGVKDLAGNAMPSDYSWTFTTSAKPDTTPPRVVDVQPSSRRKDASPSTVIAIMFSEPMDPSSVSAGTIRVASVAGDIPGTVTYNGALAAATFTPSFSFVSNTDYTITVTTGVKDLSKNAMTDAFVSSFRTAAGNDTTPPSVGSVTPTGSTVGVNAPVSVTFSEPMNAATITTSTFIVSDGSTAIPGAFKYYGTTAVFMPNTPLRYSTSYTVTIKGAVTDLAGNAMSADYTWTFTTGSEAPDTVSPSVLLTLPGNAQNNVPIYRQVVALFSETMAPGSITSATFVLVDQNGKPVQGEVAVDGALAVLTPAQPLAYNTTYTAIIGPEAADAAGNPLAGNSSAGYTWQFTTEAVAAFTITAGAGANGGINPSGAVLVNLGSDKSFTITPAANYHVADLLVDGSSVGAVTSYTFTNVINDHVISASFSINTYTIAATAGTNGSISPSGAVTVNYGASQSFTITPDTGYHVADILVDGVSKGTAGLYPFSNVTANHTISATFAVNTYTVTPSVSTGHGTISPGTSQTVNYNTTASFTLTPDANYHAVVGGTCGGTLSGDGLSYTTNPITANCTVVASFAPDPYVLTITKSGSGIGNITTNTGTLAWNGNTGTATYPYGTSVTLTASSDASSTFTGWTGCDSTNGTLCTVNINAAKNVTADFTIRTFTITPSAGSNGSINPSTPQVVNYGSSVTFTFSPNDGYYISAVAVDGNPVQGLPASYTFNNVTANHTIAVSFSIGTYTITATAGTGGTISPSGTVLVTYMGSRTFTIAPSTGYRLNDVQVDNISIGPVTSYPFTNVTSNHTISASFVAKITPTITWANPASITYGTALSVTQLNATANVPGSFVYTPASGTILNAGANQILSVTFTPTDTANYNTATANIQISVNKANQSITFGALANKTMGDPPFTVSATASSGLAVSFTSQTTSVCTVAGNTVTLAAVGTCTIRASQAGNGNYNAASNVDQSFTVNSAGQTITVTTAAPGTAVYNATFPVAATASSGLPVAITTSGSCSGAGSGSATITMNSGTGTCTVHYNQAGNSTYGAAPEVSSSTTAQKSGQTITFGALADKTVVDAPFTVSATASSGLPVSFTSQTPSVCTVAGNTVTLVATGACTIRASQAGDSNYNAAANVDQSLTVSNAGQTINVTTAAPTNAVYNTNFNVAATASSGLTVAITTSGVCTGSGSGSATITMNSGTGTCTVHYNQAGNGTYGAAPEVTNNTTAQKDGQTISFGALVNKTMVDTPFTVSATATSGLAVSFSSQTPSVCTVAGNTVTLVATGTCKIRASQAGDSNYNVAPNVDQSFAVSKASQSITVDTAAPASAEYNSTFPVAASASSGLPVAITTTGSCTGAGSGSATITMDSATGNCTVHYNQAGNGTYGAANEVKSTTTAQKASQTIGTISFTPAALAVSGTSTVNATGGDSGNPVIFSTLTPDVCTVSGPNGAIVTGVTAGICTVAANQAGDANYNAALQVTQDITVTN